MIRWGPVITDCQGHPEVVAGYTVLLLAVWLAGWYDCGESRCPVYAQSPWMEVGFTQATELSIPGVPPVGGVDIYEVVAVDWAGNISEDCP